MVQAHTVVLTSSVDLLQGFRVLPDPTDPPVPVAPLSNRLLILGPDTLGRECL
jgi:hypothetical protein